MGGARLDTVCKYICEKSSWGVSNLRLQKILYLAQMFHMGRHEGRRLVDTSFQAWDFGPVSPELYHRVKDFGAQPITEIGEDIFSQPGETFPEARLFQPEDPRKKTLDDICDKFLSWTPGQLVGVTHWKKGAWAKYYQPGMFGVQIPDKDIWGEYNVRQKSSH
ncbi:MAG: DUF4065 domain-containing protein [Candidatus Tokpelaia sp.]|uniref:Panacea domain-containing protein n=1 Tax=Candidatus Tokpelaia sp. TaxID=2233777 RepID=UPI0012389211|nr:Panacea domain-containing protein [Candidatus Tokpelaia sp.]KAA6205363.1 MAG: DUF4065 domain-containing protein [Candidatus Tokpelaia sp.]KAA6206795.1 MAG: DUF4065 domain-containing protein [Candidatus Tokpelaia sp.]KAA6406218.1 hypothetical protein DPQ22_00740 [Candidatus Tokpelaia sp.]